MPIHPFQRLLHHFGNPLITGGVMILDQRLEHQENGPEVIFGGILSRRYPSGFVLVGDDVIHVLSDSGYQFFILQKKRERHDTVQPVGGSFPCIRFPAEPGTVTDIGPEFIQVPAESVGLDAELIFQPSRRFDRSQGERSQLDRLN